MKDIGTIFKYQDVFLSLGSNTGDRLRYIKSAINELNSHPEIIVKSVSNIYETEPLYFTDQPDFLNCIVEICTNLTPEDLLSFCFSLETILGRKRSKQRNRPRPIDIDIVFFGSEIINNELIQIPHPCYDERKFVLIPLNEIAPDFNCPVAHRSVKEILEMCSDKSKIVPYTMGESLV